MSLPCGWVRRGKSRLYQYRLDSPLVRALFPEGFPDILAEGGKDGHIPVDAKAKIGPVRRGQGDHCLADYRVSGGKHESGTN